MKRASTSRKASSQSPLLMLLLKKKEEGVEKEMPRVGRGLVGYVSSFDIVMSMTSSCRGAREPAQRCMDEAGSAGHERAELINVDQKGVGGRSFYPRISSRLNAHRHG